MSEIIWGTMSAGNIYYEEVVQYVPVGWAAASANSIPAQMLSCMVGQGYIIPLKNNNKNCYFLPCKTGCNNLKLY